MIVQRLSLVLSLCLAGTSGTSSASTWQSSASLAELALRYCIDPDGDHRLTWALAERDGFSVISEAEVSGLRLRGSVASALRGFRKVEDGKQTQVLTSSSFLRAPDQGTTYYRWCWVSSSSNGFDGVNRDLTEFLRVPSFRVDKVRLFAWIPRPDGTSELVSRRRYLDQGNPLARDQGMRQVTIRRLGDGVSIGYASPRDEATYREFDWAGPEPVPAPE